LLAVLVCCVGLLWGKLSVPDTLVIDCATRYQTIEGFGAACAFWDASSAAVYADPGFQERIVNDLGLTILRFEVNPQLQAKEDLDATGTLDLAKFDFNALTTAGNLATALQPRVGPDFKVIASVWSPPAWMKTNGSTRNGGTLRVDRVPHFAKYCLGLCKGFEKTYGVPLYALSLQNEPLFAEPYDSCVYTAEQLRDVTRAVRGAITNRDVSTRLMGHEDVGCGFAQRYLNLLAPTVRDVPDGLDFFCIHGYAGDGKTAETGRRNWAALHDGLASYNHELWMTETSGHAFDSWGGGMAVARHIHESLVYGHCSAWLYWQLTMPHGKVGYALCMDGQPTVKYHAAKHFFRYVRPQAVRVAATPDTAAVNVSAFVHDGDRTVTVVLINNLRTPRRATLRVTGAPWPVTTFSAVASTRERSGTPLGDVAVNAHGAFTIEAPAESVLTLQARAAS